ncbi:PHP domain-containing protein [Planctomyces sp. SH-PL62]|uniref:PHP domain-containing protein n=1 Tax=Planctomyces sp. SH-PL62 TaxID=1636152 RepID=UPI00078CEC71|nr:PHP domain-containing protein [Planctomyces sp. SH-PL62]AMV40339.1 Error-prone DNA polymerase [Planctomyces sp. SH-PL62]
MNRRDADLHIHTTHSDGACSPREVVVAAAQVGLAALAITDHDTVSALPPARDEAARLGVELVPGVELTCEYQGREVHLLGYFFHDHPDLLAAVDRLRTERVGRFAEMADKLNELDLIVDLTAVRRCFPRAVLGRRHLAEYLFRTKQTETVREAFDLYLADGRPACVEKARLDAFEAIALVRRAGGVVSWAHPPYNLKFDSLRTLAEAGLGAVETAGPGVQNRVGRRFRDWAELLDLVPTAGSDFHAPDRPGRRVGATTTPDADLERLRRRATGTSDPATA